MSKKNIIITVVTVFLAVTAVFFGINYTGDDINKVSDAVETVTNIIEETQATKEIPKLNKEDEKTLEKQEANLEAEGFKRQGDIAYNGSDKTPKISVGKYQGLTYYSQADKRWANTMYSVTNSKSQTIEVSGCGPTCASMIVSSIRGTITPLEMAKWYVKYGYRSKNNGTYWSAMKWTADVFNIGYKETESLDTAIKLLKENYYIVAICNEGLFTYGGHFIVLTGLDKDTIKIYDPYLYYGKFDVASRKGKATIKGNTVYVTKENFKKYANAQMYYCFKNDRVDKEEPAPAKKVTAPKPKTMTVVATKGLNIRSGRGTKYKVVGTYKYNTKIKVTDIKNNWGKTDKGYVCTTYLK